MAGLLSKDRIIAKPGFNRWYVPPASIAIHLCIGSVYAWSIFNDPLRRIFGVVTSAPGDWKLAAVTPIFTLAIVFLGLSAAVGGKWLEKAGPRKVGVVAACCWGGGFLVGGVGILLHKLWLIYAGYGVIGGCGLGLGYVSPVSTLIKWFPDRRGMATGMAIMGFGGGALIATPLKQWLMSIFYKAPTLLAGVTEGDLVTREGARFAQHAGSLREVVVIGANEASETVQQGVYLAKTGNVGVAPAFLILGALYLVVMLVAAFAYRIPAPGWKPRRKRGWTPPDENQAAKRMITRHNVHADQALKTPQFYLLWVVLCFNVTAGIGVLAVAKQMMSEIFGTALPHIVTGGFAAVFVLMISVFNMSGRFFWSTMSDQIGRKRTYMIFFILGIVLYLSIPLWAYQAAVAPAVVWLVCFYIVAMIIFTMYGGGFATIPAYLADIFGTRNVGAIHGRLLTAWSTAGVLGPMAITWLREKTSVDALHKLAAGVDPAAFQAKFGAPIEQLHLLVEKKTVTIAKLMQIAPEGTIDPTSGLYNTTMFLMAGLLAIALVANILVRPVKERHLIRDGQ